MAHVTQKQVLQNLRAVLEAGGSSVPDVVKVNIFLADMGDFAAVNEVYDSFFPHPKPVCYFPSPIYFFYVILRRSKVVLIGGGRLGLVWRSRLCLWGRMWRLSVQGW
jgi:hypothetical protein